MQRNPPRVRACHASPAWLCFVVVVIVVFVIVIMVIRYSVVLRSRKLPMGLLVDPQKRSAANLLEVEGFGAVRRCLESKGPEGPSNQRISIAAAYLPIIPLF